MPNENRAAYLDVDHRFTVRREAIPQPGPGEALVRVRANGICGSDVHFFERGRLGNFVVTGPYVPGHEASGEVVAVGEGVTELAGGDRVVIEPGVPCGTCRTCRGGRYNLCPAVVFLSAPPINGTFRDYLTIRADALHPMPEGMTFEQGALVEPAAVAVHALRRANLAPGVSAVVLGCGPIGLMVLQAFRAAGGGEAYAIDTVASRREKALALGAAEAFAPDQAPDNLADAVFETAGASRATASAFRLANVAGTVVQVGWPEVNTVGVDVADLLEKELTYVGVNRYANAFAPAITWIADGRIQTDPLITHRFGLDDIQHAFEFTRDHHGQVIKAIVTHE